jgi:hypothetical protein
VLKSKPSKKLIMLAALMLGLPFNPVAVDMASTVLLILEAFLF